MRLIDSATRKEGKEKRLGNGSGSDLDSGPWSTQFSNAQGIPKVHFGGVVWLTEFR